MIQCLQVFISANSFISQWEIFVAIPINNNVSVTTSAFQVMLILAHFFSFQFIHVIS